ncbi:MAG: anaerobic ribonucleoside-triphosphate reductase activating protein [Desulfobacterota bacterium]|nr:anaerobic ribonucleoside-triphosphate reductase activating protein [Thermodesulfobacteriota bacterium]
MLSLNQEVIPIKGFLETSFLDWPGKLTAVIFLPGCNFRCPFCQNYDLVLNPQSLPSIPITEVVHRLNKLKGWVDGICLTGGEPTIHSNLPDFIRIFKDSSFLIKLDTNGSNPVLIEYLLKEGLIDAVAMDIKAPLEEIFYSRLSGVGINLARIKKSIILLQEQERAIDVIFRITVVPELLTEKDIYRLAKELSPAKKLLLQQFNPEKVLNSELKKIKPWTQEKLDEVQKQVDQILNS